MLVIKTPIYAHERDEETGQRLIYTYNWTQTHEFEIEHEIEVKYPKKATNPPIIFSCFSKEEIKDYDAYFETPAVIPTDWLPEGVIGGTLHPHLIGVSDA